MSQTGEGGGDFDVWGEVVNCDDDDVTSVTDDVDETVYPNEDDTTIKRPKVDLPKDPNDIYSALEVLENSDPPFLSFVLKNKNGIDSYVTSDPVTWIVIFLLNSLRSLKCNVKI